MEYLLIAVLVISLVGTYFLMNIRASKKQTEEKIELSGDFS